MPYKFNCGDRVEIVCDDLEHYGIPNEFNHTTATITEYVGFIRFADGYYHAYFLSCNNGYNFCWPEIVLKRKKSKLKQALSNTEVKNV